MTASVDKPCACWTNKAFLHDGHCCFRVSLPETGPVPCGHQDEGMARLRKREARCEGCGRFIRPADARIVWGPIQSSGPESEACVHCRPDLSEGTEK